MILYLENIKLIAHKETKPLMSNRRGMQWRESEIRIDNKQIKCYLDIRFGNAIYFKIENSWYRIVMKKDYYDENKGVVEYSFNPTTQKLKLKTQAPCEQLM